MFKQNMTLLFGYFKFKVSVLKITFIMSVMVLMINLVMVSVLAAKQMDSKTVQQADTRIHQPFAILDHDHIMDECLAGRQARLEIEKNRTLFQEEMDRQEHQLRTLEKQLIALQHTLNEEQYANKRQEFEGSVAETHKMVAEKRKKLDESSNRLRETVIQSILEIVNELAKERGYTVVLPRSMIFYADQTYDITSDVLQELNKRLPAVSLSNSIK